MYVAGIDIGSATSKVAILNDDEVIAIHIIQTGPESRASAETAMAGGLRKSGLRMEDLKYIVATGYGRVNVPFAEDVITEIACHAKGVHFLFPNARTILDIGGQDCKTIRINAAGNHVAFVMNDKCAAGTGRFLEIMSVLLKVSLMEIGPLSLQASEDTKISNVCTVFARSEAARHLRRGVPKANILGGLNAATAEQAFSLLKRVGIEADLVISGGVAKNTGVVRRLERKVGIAVCVPKEPQITGALGAALFAHDRYHRMVDHLSIHRGESVP